MLAWVKGNFHENYPKKCFLTKKKKPGLSADRRLRTTAPSRTSIAPVKQKVICLHAQSTLASVSSNKKHLRRTIRYHADH